MCEAEDIKKYNEILADLSAVFTKAMRHEIKFTLNAASELVTVTLDDKVVRFQSVGGDSFDAAIVDLCHCFPDLAKAFRDTYC